MLGFRCRIGLLCAALIGVVGWRVSLFHHESEAFASPTAASVSDVAVGSVAPAFSVSDRGRQVAREDLHGQTVVLCFSSPASEKSRRPSARRCSSTSSIRMPTSLSAPTDTSRRTTNVQSSRVPGLTASTASLLVEGDHTGIRAQGDRWKRPRRRGQSGRSRT